MSNEAAATTEPDVFADIAQMRADLDEEQGAQWHDELPLRMWPCLIVRHVGHLSEEWFDPGVRTHAGRLVMCRDRLVRLAATAVAGAEAIARRRAAQGDIATLTRTEVLNRVRARSADVTLRSDDGSDVMLHICDLAGPAGHLAEVCTLAAFADEPWRAQGSLTQIAAIAAKILRHLDHGDF